MNEKIKLLAEQAGEYVNEVYTPPVRSKTPGKIWEDGHIDWMEQFNEKFAELIVRECVGILEPKSRYMGEGPEVLKDKIRQIKKHFGVEE
jgi:hypothetical protein